MKAKVLVRNDVIKMKVLVERRGVKVLVEKDGIKLKMLVEKINESECW